MARLVMMDEVVCRSLQITPNNYGHPPACCQTSILTLQRLAIMILWVLEC